MSHESLLPAGPNSGLPIGASAPLPDRVLKTSEVAQMLRLSTRTLERLVETGEAPPRIQLSGRRVGYWRSDVIAWLQARTSPAKRAA